jgi:hypothetical protein
MIKSTPKRGKAMAKTPSYPIHRSNASKANVHVNQRPGKIWTVTAAIALAVAALLFGPNESNRLIVSVPSLKAEEAKLPPCTDQSILERLMYNMFTIMKQQALKADPNDETAKKWSASIENIRQLSEGGDTRVCKADLIYDSLPAFSPWTVPAAAQMLQAGCLWKNMTYDGHVSVSFIYKLETLLDKPDQIHFEWMCVH